MNANGTNPLDVPYIWHSRPKESPWQWRSLWYYLWKTFLQCFYQMLPNNLKNKTKNKKTFNTLMVLNTLSYLHSSFQWCRRMLRIWLTAKVSAPDPGSRRGRKSLCLVQFSRLWLPQNFCTKTTLTTFLLTPCISMTWVSGTGPEDHLDTISFYVLSGHPV